MASPDLAPNVGLFHRVLRHGLALFLRQTEVMFVELRSGSTDQMPPETPGVRELTRRLVASEATQSDAPESAALAAHAACERTYRELTRTIGVSGSETLLLRALARTQTQYPLLTKVRIGRLATPDLDGVTAMVQAHGAPEVAAALEAVLETLLDLLGRLIGEDMVVRLVEQSAPIVTQDDRDVPRKVCRQELRRG
jgi:hypothetical protein